MVNLCGKCDKVINEGEEIEMTIEGKYRLIASVNTFALYKNKIVYRMNTLCHVECKEDKYV